jgi:hypothetical protein
MKCLFRRYCSNGNFGVTSLSICVAERSALNIHHLANLSALHEGTKVHGVVERDIVVSDFPEEVKRVGELGIRSGDVELSLRPVWENIVSIKL